MRRTWPDIPGVAVWPWPRDGRMEFRIVDEPGPPVDAGAVEAEWLRQCRANPRLFDGPILSVVGLDPGGQMRIRRDSYKRLTVQPAVQTGVEQLSVTGVVFRNDRILLARRSPQTRIYGGMWELAPSGGVDPSSRVSLCEGDLIEQLRFEFAEELGVMGAIDILRPVAICQDLRARSCDVVFPCSLRASLRDLSKDPEAWEYEDSRWIEESSIAEFDRDHAAQVIPPTRAMFRLFGWV